MQIFVKKIGYRGSYLFVSRGIASFLLESMVCKPVFARMQVYWPVYLA
jgi:hypothetical protein